MDWLLVTAKAILSLFLEFSFFTIKLFTDDINDGVKDLVQNIGDTHHSILVDYATSCSIVSFMMLTRGCSVLFGGHEVWGA